MIEPRDEREEGVRRSLHRRLLAGYLTVAVFLVGILGYAAVVQIRGAVVAPGNIVVEGNIRKVQHQDGGSVAQIYVHNGNKVAAGDMLVRLNDSQPRAELGVILVQLYGQMVRAARLGAERDKQPSVRFPPMFSEAGLEKDSVNIIQGENALFVARQTAREGEIAQLQGRIEQTEQEIEGLNAQLGAVQEQVTINKDELANLEKLMKQGLTQMSRINPQRNSRAQLEGQVGDIKAQIARARGKIAEIGVQIAQIDRTNLNDVTKDLREATEKIADLQERRVAAESKLQRVEIKAPVAGLIHQLAVFTIGGVVAPGDTVMQIVPEDDKLLVESRIEPQFVDQVAVGQDALIRFSSFDQRQTPELYGKVVFISADLEQDAKQSNNNAPYFRARVELKPGEVEKLGDQKMISGLPAELHLQTRERTILSYFMKPFTDQIARTFRER